MPIPVQQLLFWGIPIIAFASYCFLMSILFLSKKDKYIRAFMLLVLALMIWTASTLLMKLVIPPGVVFWNRVMVTATILVPFLVYYFVSVFTHSENQYRFTFLSVVAAVAIALNWMGLVITDPTVVTDTVVYNGQLFEMVEFNYSMGIAAYPVFAFTGLLISVIIYRTRESLNTDNSTYKQVRLIVIGIVIMFIGALLNIFPSIGKYPVDILACLINAILITIAIYKYRMLELRFVVTKSIVFFLVVALLTVLYVYLVFFIQRYFGRVYPDASPYLQTISALLIAVAFQPVYGLSRRLVNKMFFKSEYSRRQALRRFSETLSNNLNLEDIAQELVEAVKMAIHCRHIYVLLSNEDKEEYHVFASSSHILKPNFAISFECPIVKWFFADNACISKEDLYTQPFFKGMWEEEKRALYEYGIEVIIPIKSRNKLIGMLMLTSKDNNTAYTMEDIDLLTYLGNSTAVAFDNARLYSQAQRDALSDSLTQLNNHRYFRKSLAQWMKKIGSDELSLLMLDLDLFKLFNDLHGHTAGDQALKTVAAIMMRVVGDKGVVCRYGGEEFTILLPYHDAKKAYDLAETIRLEVQKAFSEASSSNQLFLTVSIGICTYPHAAPDAEELIRRADLGMYTAKKRGKNQTVIYTPNFEPTEQGVLSHEADISNAATIYALTATIDAKDQYTFGHSQRVAEYATILAGAMGLDKPHVEMIREAALLHDIGKIGVPENILTKKDRLTAEEYDLVKKHVDMSITIIKHLPSCNHVIPAVLGHHERWDGKGYPRGIEGENIAIGARCLALADAFDALTSNRPYRSRFPVEAALMEIRNGSGTQFDPEITDLFIKLVRDGIINVDYERNQSADRSADRNDDRSAGMC